MTTVPTKRKRGLLDVAADLYEQSDIIGPQYMELLKSSRNLKDYKDYYDILAKIEGAMKNPDAGLATINVVINGGEITSEVVHKPAVPMVQEVEPQALPEPEPEEALVDFSFLGMDDL